MTKAPDSRAPSRDRDTPENRASAIVKLFYEGLGMGVLVAQRRTHSIVWSSPIAERQLGWSAAEMRGRAIDFLYADTVELQDLLCHAEEALDEVGVFRGEIVVRRRDGSSFESEQSFNRLVDPTRYQIAIRDISARKESERALAQSRDELRGLWVRLQSLREEERARIARGLQEELGQELTALALDLKMLRDRIHFEHHPTLDRLIASTKGTLDHVQEVCANLRPAILDHLGLVAAIEWVAADFEKRTGIGCQVDLDERSFEDLVDPHAIVLLRIVQESLLNVRRHAGAHSVHIHLGKETPGRILLTVADDGVGIAPETLESSDSLGLLSIRERARVLGGWSEIRRGPAGGTIVDVRVPWPG